MKTRNLILKLIVTLASMQATAAGSLKGGDVGNEQSTPDGQPRSVALPMCNERYDRWDDFMAQVNAREDQTYAKFFAMIEDIYLPLQGEIQKVAENSVVCLTDQSINKTIAGLPPGDPRFALWIEKGAVKKDLLLVDTTLFFAPQVTSAARAATLMRELLHPILASQYAHDLQLEWAKRTLTFTLHEKYINPDSISHEKILRDLDQLRLMVPHLDLGIICNRKPSRCREAYDSYVKIYGEEEALYRLLQGGDAGDKTPFDKITFVFDEVARQLKNNPDAMTSVARTSLLSIVQKAIMQFDGDGDRSAVDQMRGLAKTLLESDSIGEDNAKLFASAVYASLVMRAHSGFTGVGFNDPFEMKQKIFVYAMNASRSKKDSLELTREIIRYAEEFLSQYQTQIFLEAKDIWQFLLEESLSLKTIEFLRLAGWTDEKILSAPWLTQTLVLGLFPGYSSTHEEKAQARRDREEFIVQNIEFLKKVNWRRICHLARLLNGDDQVPTYARLVDLGIIKKNYKINESSTLRELLSQSPEYKEIAKKLERWPTTAK